MKVGILNYYNAINYGAVLQAYALQEAITSMGYVAETIDYPCEAVEKQYRRKTVKDRASWKTYVKEMIFPNRLAKKKLAFADFREQYLNLSQRTIQITSEFADRYDVLVVGSDQVFNPKNTEGDSTFLLDIDCDALKIAYAASIGDNRYLEMWKSKYCVDYVPLLKDFYAMSFRESDAAEYVSQLLCGDYTTVLDPVLLMEESFWRRFQNEKDDEYVFVYNLGNLPSLVKIVDRVKKQTNLKVVVVNKDVKGDLFLWKYNNCSSLSPQEFVSAIANAKYIITDSFHGTAFSILLHKDFYSVANVNKENTNSRLHNLLSMLSLENRYITEVEQFDFQPMPEYAKIDNALQAMRSSSLMWLKNSLDRATQRSSHDNN